MKNSSGKRSEEVARNNGFSEPCSRDILAWFKTQISDTKLTPSIAQPLFLR